MLRPTACQKTYRFAAAVLLICLLSACATDGSQRQARQALSTDVARAVAGKQSAEPERETFESPVSQTPVGRAKGFVKRAESTRPRGLRLAQNGGRTAIETEPNGNISLNFIDADLISVVDAILGDKLGENYIIEDDVSGAVTLQTNRPLNRAQLLSTLQEILAMNDAAMAPGDGLYKITRRRGDREAPKISFAEAGSRGLSVRVTPLTHASAEAVGRMLGSFAPANGRVEIDADRNVIFSVATPAEQRSISDVIAVLDVDFLSKRAFALEPLDEARAGAMVNELEAIMGGQVEEEGYVRGLVKFLAIDRMNAVLVIAESNQALDDAREWIRRLDQGTGDGQQLFVYPVKNRRADDLAKIVGQLFYIDTGFDKGYGGGLAPGLYPTTLESDTSDAPAGGNGFGGNGFGGNGFGSSFNRLTQPATAGGQDGGFYGGNGDSGVRVIADNGTNALVVYADYNAYKPIKAALDRLDVLPVQVLIEATLVEVSLRNDLEFGVRWFFENGDTRIDFTDLAEGGVNPAATGFNFILDTIDAQVVISALRQVTDVEFLSAPNMMVLDNQVARLQVGDEVPIQTRTSIGTTDPDAPIVNDIEYRNTGVILTVRPKVTSDGLVVLDVIQEVSDVIPTVTSGIVSPTIQQRRFDSTVAVASGETVILGGLTSRDTELGRTGVPLLSSIPLVGNAFTSRANKRTRTELLVLITPKVIRDQRSARAATDEMRTKLLDLFRDAPDQDERLIHPMRTFDGSPDFTEQPPAIEKIAPRSDPRPY